MFHMDTSILMSLSLPGRQGLEQACGPGCEHAHSNRSWSTSPSGCCRPHLLFLQSRSGHCSSLRYGIGVHGVSMEGHRWEWDIGRLATYGLTWALPNLAQPLITFVSHPTSSREKKQEGISRVVSRNAQMLLCA